MERLTGTPWSSSTAWIYLSINVLFLADASLVEVTALRESTILVSVHPICSKTMPVKGVSGRLAHP